MTAISASWLCTTDRANGTRTSFEERSSAASAISIAPRWWAIISSRKRRSASTPVEARRVIPVYRGVGPALGQAPAGKPAVELARLLGLRGGDVVGQQPHVGVVGLVAHDHGELPALLGGHLHVTGESPPDPL